ncbi:MAG: cysteine--tRNA ligase [Candidatus Micrarchaeota archaeon]
MLRLYDTLSRRKRPFRPLKGKTVRIYTCGPSVYEYSHIGNFRTYLFEDVLVRYLKFKGYSIFRVMNVTDVEDKAVEAARRQGVSIEKLVKEKCRTFFSDFGRLGMLRPDIIAKASDYVPQMISLISRICMRGYCIPRKDGLYFNSRKFGRYGELRGLKSRRFLGAAHKDDYAREGVWDFRLWKKWTRGDGDVAWESPWGRGRPGWHIECSAISMHHLGESFDIHCGGVDNIFPHHENERAQCEAATGRRFVNFWLHCRHLTIGKRKMSKRTGNVLYVRELEGMGVPPEFLRFYLISERHQNPLDFTMERFRDRVCACDGAKDTLKRLRTLRAGGDGKAGARIAAGLLAGFERAMDDDLNTKLALKRLFAVMGRVKELLRRGRLGGEDAKRIVRAAERVDAVLGIL